jgi:hypothetical protein
LGIICFDLLSFPLDHKPAYTRAGDYNVELNVEGVDGLAALKRIPLRITGVIQTPFPVSKSRRYIDETKP